MRKRLYEYSHGERTELCIDVTNKNIKRLYIAANDILSINALTKLFVVKKLEDGFMEGKVFVEANRFLEILKENEELLGSLVSKSAYNHVRYIMTKVAKREEKIISKIFPNIMPLIDDNLTVTSKNVAGVFERQHTGVCQYIQKIRAAYGKDWFNENFSKEEDGFRMNQEGLIRLAETFRREKDKSLLAAYNKAFMEKYQAMIKENQSYKNTSVEEKKQLIEKIKELSELSNVPASKISKEIYNISIKDILQTAMDKDTFYAINAKLDKKIAEFQYWINSKPC